MSLQLKAGRHLVHAVRFACFQAYLSYGPAFICTKLMWNSLSSQRTYYKKKNVMSSCDKGK